VLTFGFEHNIVYNTAAKTFGFLDEDPPANSKYLGEKAARFWIYKRRVSGTFSLFFTINPKRYERKINTQWSIGD